MNKILLLSAFLTGFAAIALEVLWTRVMVMVVGGSVYAFTIVLVCFLVGIAIGSLVAAFSSRMLTNVKRIQTNERMLAFLVFAGLQILIGVLVIFTIPAYVELPFAFLDLFKHNTPAFGLLMFQETLLVLRVIFIPTILMGIAFPLLIRIHSRNSNSDSIGMSVGKIYGANTFGGVLGAFAAGFILIPLIGVQMGIFGAGIIYLIVGALVLLHFYSSSERSKSRSDVIPDLIGNLDSRFRGNDRFSSRPARTIINIVVMLIVVGIILAGLRMAPWDRQLLSSGFYKDPFIYADSDKTQIIKKLKKAEILFEKEGISAHVVVSKEKDGTLSLRINGKADASTGSDMENQLLLGHLPMFLHPSAGSGSKDVLVVGLGSGITLGSILSHPVEHVDAIEIEEKVVEAAKFFNKYSNNALDDPRVNIVVADGRHYLMASGKKYDVITSEPSNPWLSGSSKLFTKEYFELLRKGIKEDGVVLQWINLYAINVEGFKRVLAAFKQVFPEMLVFGMPASNDLALVGANHQLMFDSGRLEKLLDDKQIKSDLAKVGIKNPFELLAYFVMDGQGVKKVVGNTRANTDDNPYVEFQAPKFLYSSVATNPWRVILDNLSPIEAITSLSLRGTNGMSDEAISEIAAPLDTLGARNDTLRKAEDFRRSRLLTQIYSIEKNVGDGIKEGEKALAIDADNLFIKNTLAKLYFEEGTSFFNQSDYGKAISAFSKSVNLKKTPEAYFNLGQSYGWSGDLEKARENYEASVNQDSEFEQGWEWLGDTLSELGDLNGAIRSYQQAIKLNPENVKAYVALGNLYILRKDFGKAEEFLNKVLELDPNNEEVLKLMKTMP